MHPMIANIVNIMFKLFGLTLFWPMFPFYIPWQTSESLCFPGVFRCLNKKVGQKWISHFESTFAYIGNNMYLFVFFFVKHSKYVCPFQILCLPNLFYEVFRIFSQSSFRTNFVAVINFVNFFQSN